MKVVISVVLLQLVALLLCDTVVSMDGNGHHHGHHGHGGPARPNPCTIDNGGCCENAICIPHPHHYRVTCMCKDGYTGDGHYCTLITTTTEAETTTCTTTTTTEEDTTTTSETTTTTTTEPEVTTTTCTTTTTEYVPPPTCDVNNGGCCKNARCFQKKNGVKCRCKKGYEGDGITCTDINECDKVHPCHDCATCNNTVGGYTCTCNDGYRGNGRHCRKIKGKKDDDDDDDDDDHAGPCDHNGGCKASCQEKRCMKGCKKCGQCNRYAKCEVKCVCKKGFIGDGHNCEDINECEDGDNGGCDENAECINKPGRRICVCKDGYTGVGVGPGSCTLIVATGPI